MPEVEVDSFSDGGKPFDPNKSSKPLEAPVNVAAELGLDTSQADDEKTPSEEDENPEKDALSDVKDKDKLPDKSKEVLKNYAAKLQEESEQLYESMSYRAKTEDGYMDTLVNSSDPVEKKMAKKILQRNSDHFGAKTPEDYKLKVAKDNAGDNEDAKALAELRFKQEQLEAKQNEKDWESWKKDNSVTGDAAKIADEIHEEYPDLKRGIIMDAVKSRMSGDKPLQKEAGSTVAGGEGAAQEESINMQSPVARSLLRNVDIKETTKFAKKEYSL